MKHLLSFIFLICSFGTFAHTVADTIPVTNTVILDASDSKDDDGSVVKYQWTQTGGTTVTILNASTSKGTVTFTQAGTYYFQADVTDNDGATGTANMVVTVLAANIPPKAVIKATQVTIKLPGK